MAAVQIHLTMQDKTYIKTLTPADSLYGVEPKPVNSFNSTKTFTDTAWEVTRQARERSLDKIQDIVDSTKRKISNE